MNKFCSGRDVLLTTVVALLLHACVSESGGATIEDALAFDRQCFIRPTALTQSFGSFDPVGGVSYELPLAVRSNLSAAETGALGPSDEELNPSSALAVIEGFDTCMLLVSEFERKPLDGKPVVDCADVPATRRRFIPASASIDEGERLAVSVRVLTPEDLQGLFGEAFDVGAIPVAPSAVENGVIINRQGTEDRDQPNCGSTTEACRSDAWGTYPRTGTVSVLVQLRARLKRVGGTVFYSNWFSFPIEIFMGRTLTDCGPLTLGRCAGGCPGAVDCPEPVAGEQCAVDTASSCIVSECAPGEPSCRAYGLRGERFSPVGCKPFQFAGGGICEAYNECSPQ